MGNGWTAVSGDVAQLTSADFYDAVEGSDLVLVDFWAGWCWACRAFAPIFASAAACHPEVQFAWVDAVAEAKLAERFEIVSIPTVLAFVRGEVVHRAEGAMPAGDLERLVRGLLTLDDATIKARREARARTANGERPKGVPARASWNDDEERWESGRKNRRGRQGLWQQWRADGTLATEAAYLDDELHGPWRELHEDGTVAATGEYARGRTVGTHSFFAPRGYSTFELPFDEVDVARVEFDHDVAGETLRIRKWDRDGGLVYDAKLCEEEPDGRLLLRAAGA
jgi:thioredoxin